LGSPNRRRIPGIATPKLVCNDPRGKEGNDAATTPGAGVASYPLVLRLRNILKARLAWCPWRDERSGSQRFVREFAVAGNEVTPEISLQRATYNRPA
jgi:hypothetical protein